MGGEGEATRVCGWVTGRRPKSVGGCEGPQAAAEVDAQLDHCLEEDDCLLPTHYLLLTCLPTHSLTH